MDDALAAAQELKVEAEALLGRTSVLDLTRELADLPGLATIYYRNEFVIETEGNPRALFLCLEFLLPGATRWKVDLLIADGDEVQRVLAPGRSLVDRLTTESRKRILLIKAAVCRRPEYRREYGSRAIYEAVLTPSCSGVGAAPSRTGCAE